MDIFFDFDGTLVNAENRTYQLYADYCHDKNVIPMPLSEYVAKKKEGITEREIATSSLRENVEEYLVWKRKHIEDPHYVKLDSVYRGIIPLLATLRKDHSLYVLTSRYDRKVLFEEMHQEKLNTFFREIITAPGKDGVACKRQGLSDALNRYHLEYSSMVLVGDTEIEIGAAKILKISCISVTYGLRGKQFFSNVGQTRIVDTVWELSDALITLSKSTV